MKGLVGLLVGALCAVVIACAAGAKQPAAMRQPTMAPAEQPQSTHVQEFPQPSSPDDNDIARLSREIDNQRQEMNLGVVAHTPHMLAPAEAMAVNPATCKRSESDSCKQTCTLSDSICSNAKKICEIANKLAGDQWAAQKCNDGLDTCTAANDRCCACS